MLLYIPRPGGGYFFARRLFRRGGNTQAPQKKPRTAYRRSGATPPGRRGAPALYIFAPSAAGFLCGKIFLPAGFSAGAGKAELRIFLSRKRPAVLNGSGVCRAGGSAKKPRTAYRRAELFFRKMCGGKGFFPPAGVICSGNPSSRLSSRKQGSLCPRRTRWACSNNP